MDTGTGRVGARSVIAIPSASRRALTSPPAKRMSSESPPFVRNADHEDAVGAHAPPAVADLTNAVRGERDRAVHDQEVVPAAVHLREFQAAASRIASVGSSAVGSYHRIVASLRNHVIWRRE